MKPFKIILAHFLALIFAGHVRLHSVDVYPERLTGIVGGEVQINCDVVYGPNDEMTWDWDKVFVYYIAGGTEHYPKGTRKYSVQITGMNFALTVKDLRLEDGGEYMCTSFTSEATAVLVVLDTPSITLHPLAPLEGEKVRVTCEARFGGPRRDLILPDHFPNLKMHLNDSSLNETFTEKATNDDRENVFILSMTKNLTVHASMNTRRITCEIRTAEPSMKTSDVAVLNVLYSVKDIHITPNQEKHKVGDNISCFASGNPPIVYEWRKVDGGTPIYGKWLMITESMIGENNWECVARNIINGEWFEKRRQRSFVTSDPYKSGDDSSAVTIAVVTVIIIILVIIAAVAFYSWKKIKKSKGSSTNGNANNLQELGSVEAEELLPTIQQENDVASAPEHSIQPNIQQGKDGSNSSNHSTEITIQDQQSDVTKILQQNIEQGNGCSGSTEHSVKPMIKQERHCSSASEHSIQPNIQKGNDGSDSSKHLVEVKIQEQKLEVTTPIQKNIPQGRNGPGASEHTTLVTNKEQQSDVKKLLQRNISQANDGSGPSKHSIKQNVPQGSDGSGSLKHSIKDEKTKAPKLGSLQCIELLNSVENNQELDRKGEEILRTLKEDRKSILEKDPNILMVLIKNADKLIDSEYYEDIIKVAPHGGEDSPLKSLLDILSDKGRLKILMKNQNKLFSVIRIISSYGDVQYRTECLKYIIIKRTFGEEREKREYSFEWSEEYLSTVKDLLENGADPTWIDPEEMKKRRSDRTTAQNGFFGKIFVNLWEKNDLHESLLGVVILMLSKKCNNYELLRATLLHEFVGFDRWDYIATNRESMPRDFFRQFRNILREILIRDGTLLVQKDSRWGRTPLQRFLRCIRLEERIFGEVREIIQMLQSPQEVLSSQDNNGWTALHYLAYFFPVIRGEVTQSGRESFLELVKSFANESNVGCQDWKGRTALHHLAQKFRYRISEEWREVYQDLVKHLSTYDILEIKDKDRWGGGRTALHFLADGFTFEIEDKKKGKTFEIEDWKMETFVEVLKCLAVPTTICIKDKKGYDTYGETALEMISRKWGKKVPEHYKDKFQEISDILCGNN